MTEVKDLFLCFCFQHVPHNQKNGYMVTKFHVDLFISADLDINFEDTIQYCTCLIKKK